MVHRSSVYLIISSVFKLATCSQSLFDEDLYKSVLDNVTCERNLKDISIIQFYDASGRIPQSITLGGQGSLGNYHQCLSIAQQGPNDTISGKYCMIRVPIQLSTQQPPALSSRQNQNLFEFVNMSNNNTKIEDSQFFKRALQVILGDGDRETRANPVTGGGLSVQLPICIPKSCTTHDAVDMFAVLLNVTYQDQYCRLPNDKIFSAVDIIAVVTVVILGTLTVLSTGYDLYYVFALRKDAAEISKVLTCCSIYTNTHRLLTFSRTPSTIDCLDGIRALSILWVVVGHSFSNIALGTVVNLLTVYEWVSSRDAIWVLSAVLSVDTFFMMSGLLVVYTTVSKMTPMSLVKSLHLFYLHRWLRMFPLLAAVMLYQASLIHHSADGPSWPNLSGSVQSCRKWWWSALLHVQNYVNPTEMCLSHTWYLSVDMQLHIISPLVLLFVLRGRSPAWLSLAAGLLTSLISATIYCYVNNFGLTILTQGPNILDYFQHYYVNTLSRAPPFFVGMYFGYLLHLWREHPRRIPKWFVAIGWLAAFVFGLGLIYCNYPGAKMISFWQNFLNAFMRPLWGLCVGWVVFACSLGYGGPINWFLSFTMWKYLARVSYALYLIHYPLQAVVRMQSDMPVMFSVTSLNVEVPDKVLYLIHYALQAVVRVQSDVRVMFRLYTFYTDVSLSLMAATVLCVLVDAPFSTLQKIFIGGKEKLAAPSNSNRSTQNIVA